MYVCRCINADPNYGSNWFHSRQHPHENPMTVLRHTLKILKHELLSAHRVYARGIMYYVQRCIRERKTAVAAYHEARNQTASSTVVSNTINTPQKSGDSGSSSSSSNTSANTASPNTNSSDISSSSVSSSAAPPAAVYTDQDFLTDVDQAKTIMKQGWFSAASMERVPYIEVKPSCALYTYSDFVTALVAMNRTIFTRHISADQLRKNIYGSDQIIS